IFGPAPATKPNDYGPSTVGAAQMPPDEILSPVQRELQAVERRIRQGEQSLKTSPKETLDLITAIHGRLTVLALKKAGHQLSGAESKSLSDLRAKVKQLQPRAQEALFQRQEAENARLRKLAEMQAAQEEQVQQQKAQEARRQVDLLNDEIT